ncbi:MAG: serine hydroxymethyltransferase [Patescibacteria group bacterium]
MDEIFDLIKKEKERQREQVQLIPSENFISENVKKALGSCLSNKYAEGYCGKRYYQGNKVMDQIESKCQERALKAFGLDENVWGVNVQPHSGCEANLAVYNGLLDPGDKIMAMFLPDGGHLSHGWHTDKKVTLVSKIYEVEFYKVDPKTEVFDYDQIQKQAEIFRPKLIISGGTAYPREIDYARMGEIAKTVGAYYLADVSHEAGLIAGKVLSSPWKAAEVVTMTTHKTLRGPRGAMIFAKRDLIDAINKSVFPGLQGGPHMQTIAAIAVALGETQTEEFRRYAKRVVKNAKKLAEVLTKEGLKVVTGGTDKHLILVDVGVGKGKEVAVRLEEEGIVVNANTIPGEKGSPFKPSGIRLGSPAMTTKGWMEEEFEEVGEKIAKIIKQVP